MAETKITELENLIETSKTGKARAKHLEILQVQNFHNYGATIKGVASAQWQLSLGQLSLQSSSG